MLDGMAFQAFRRWDIDANGASYRDALAFEKFASVRSAARKDERARAHVGAFGAPFLDGNPHRLLNGNEPIIGSGEAVLALDLFQL
jgi:hypothetical protein